MSSESAKRVFRTLLKVLAGTALMTGVVLAAGCQSMNPLPKFGIGGKSPEEARINKLIEWHSGRVQVYRDFRTVFTARAVYLSDEIRQIAVDWEARTKLMSPEERAVFEKRYLGGDEHQLRVLVGFYTPDDEQNDLAEENTLWIPVIRNEDGSLKRAACFGVGDEEAKIYMRFLRWDLSWSKLYMLCFPYNPEKGDDFSDIVNLVISGPQGQGDIRLRIAPPEDK